MNANSQNGSQSSGGGITGWRERGDAIGPTKIGGNAGADIKNPKGRTTSPHSWVEGKKGMFTCILRKGGGPCGRKGGRGQLTQKLSTRGTQKGDKRSVCVNYS